MRFTLAKMSYMLAELSAEWPDRLEKITDLVRLELTTMPFANTELLKFDLFFLKFISSCNLIEMELVIWFIKITKIKMQGALKKKQNI